MPTPPGYGIGGTVNYYFSHILNCLYDCRYCFLQGLYQSANYVFFLNFEDFHNRMDSLLEEHGDAEQVYFFSGYDGDSFALESLTGFVSQHLDFFRNRPRAVLELRTKSLRARDLERRDALPNVVAAFSLTPAAFSQTYETGVPPLARRLRVMRDLAERGWPIGLRLDPVIVHQGFRRHYSELLHDVFCQVKPEQVHSVSLGLMRFPRAVEKQIRRLYPDEPLLAAPRVEARGQVASAAGEAPLEWLTAELGQRIPRERLFIC